MSILHYHLFAHGLIPNMKNTTQPLATVTALGLLLLMSVALISLLFGLLNTSTIFCEGYQDLPCVLSFNDLHLTENLKTAKELLADQSGVYCFAHVESGTMYVGGSTNIGERLVSHVFNYSSNLHLQRAIAIYGLPAFVFTVVEFCKLTDMVAREQFFVGLPL